MVYTINVAFEWNNEKARINAAKHGISFKTASAVFYDPFSLIEDDFRHSAGEPRYWLIGNSDKGVLMVIFTVRPGNLIRIISAWKASPEERRSYEEEKI